MILDATEEECQKNVNASLYLLLSLGFLVNYGKSQLKLSCECKYLGFIFNSIRQLIAIPPGKRNRLLVLARNISQKLQCFIREFASMIESLISVCPAVQYGFLYTKRFEKEKFLALEAHSGTYNGKMLISPILSEDFVWWIKIFSNVDQFDVIRSDPYVCEIFSDASLTDWRASCGDQRTHG